MEPLKLIELTISITGLVLTLAIHLRTKKGRAILLALVGLVLIALVISILALVAQG